MAKPNRQIKAGVFADLFGDDEKDGKKNFLSLYNAIHDTDLKFEETQIEQKKIPQSVTKSFYNDISMIINGRLIVLIEHQSTPNKNMPLRCLEYYVHLLNTIIPAEARYKEALYKIPTPEFYVFYNGEKKSEKECIMKLSDAFLEEQKELVCEVNVKFTNIKGENYENLPVVQKCDILRQYCKFIEIVNRYKTELKNCPTDEGMNNWFGKAIEEAISNNILTDYLTRNGTEVRNMLQAEYDYDLDMKVKAQEAREEAYAEARKEAYAEAKQQKAVEDALKALSLELSPEQVSQITDLPLEKVLELQKNHKIS